MSGSRRTAMFLLALGWVVLVLTQYFMGSHGYYTEKLAVFGRFLFRS